MTTPVLTTLVGGGSGLLALAAIVIFADYFAGHPWAGSAVIAVPVVAMFVVLVMRQATTLSLAIVVVMIGAVVGFGGRWLASLF